MIVVETLGSKMILLTHADINIVEEAQQIGMRFADLMVLDDRALMSDEERLSVFAAIVFRDGCVCLDRSLIHP